MCKGLDPETGVITDLKLYNRSRIMRKVWALRKKRKASGPYNPPPAISPPYHCIPKAEVVRRAS